MSRKFEDRPVDSEPSRTTQGVMKRSNLLVSCLLCVGLGSAACVVPIELVDDDGSTSSGEGTDSGDTTGSLDASDGTVDPSDTNGCAAGTPGCPCLPNSGCEAGHACADDECVPLSGDCGNGMMDAGEDCDDGNLTDADGCNADCRLSGSVVWSLDYGDPIGTGRANSVAIDSTDAIVVGGSENVDFETRGWVRKLDRQGVEQWLDVLPVDVTNLEMATGPNDRIAAGCSEEGDFGFGSLWTRTYDTTGAIEQTIDEGWDMTQGIAINPTGIVLAGGSSRIYAYDGGPGWWWPLDGQIGAMTMTPAGSFFVVGRADESDASWVASYGDSSALGDPAWSQLGPDGFARGVAIDSMGNVIVAGNDLDLLAPAWLQKLAPDGSQLWFTYLENSSGFEGLARGVAVDSHDRIVVVGDASTGFDTNAQISKLEADGEPLWTVEEQLGDANAVAIHSNDEIVVAGHLGLRIWVATYTP
ncbi:MAG: hypothetical protein K0V04_41950 [Deltaproteobacteria bacterium]|nr:hypothetical protein [Deltaproteobacteria bacterium]